MYSFKVTSKFKHIWRWNLQLYSMDINIKHSYFRVCHNYSLMIIII